MQEVIQVTPYEAKDFAWARWKPEEIAAQADAAIDKHKEAVAAVKAVSKDARTFENTLYIEEQASNWLIDVAQSLDLLMNVSSEDAVRTAAQNAKEKIDAFLVDVAYDQELYLAVKEYTDTHEKLEPDADKYVKEIVRGYKRLGLDLPEADREELKQNMKRLQELSTQFQVNINNHDDHIILAPTETGGLSESYLAGLKKDDAGNYVVTLAYPDYIPFVKLSDNDAKRKKLVEKYNRKGGEQNIALLVEAAGLRNKIARKLGYANHVAYAAEVKTAKTEEAIRSFLFDTAPKLKVIWQKEKEALLGFVKKATNNAEQQLGYWNLAYWETKQAKALYGIDPEEIREYFPMQHVLREMMDIYSTLFSVRFEKVEGIPLWHEEVTLYRVVDASGGLLSYFALDLYPRPNKYDHAAEFPLRHTVSLTLDRNGSYSPAFAPMVTNFPKDTPEQPSLMPHDQVETLFHEFGHVMHENLAHARFMGQSGTNVAGDFVEAPSQMLEYWVWQPDILRRLTKHYKTGEPMPEELIQRLVASKNHGAGFFNIRQFMLALFDHRFLVEDGHSPVELYAAIYKDLLELEPPTGQMFAAGFTHLMNPGYEGGYYGYMWSKVFAADMFSKFAADGVLNQQTGIEYRRKVLEVGSSREEMDSVKDSLGREPNNKAFLEELGLES